MPDNITQIVGTHDAKAIERLPGLDEAPQAIADCRTCSPPAATRIRVVHTLRPIIVAMAGENEVDPYKD